MKVAYENDGSVREMVAAMVPTYRPENVGRKDGAYESQVRQMASVR